MKGYRTWCLFRRRRQQQQEQIYKRIAILLIIALGLFLLNLILGSDHWTTFSDNFETSSNVNCHCSRSSFIALKHGECFFNQPVCHPGFVGRQCEIRLKNESYRSHCPWDVHRTEWTLKFYNKIKKQCSQSNSAQKIWNTSCLFLCFYHRSTGIIQVPEIFWERSLKNELSYWKLNPMSIEDRLYEHVQGFHGYKIIPLKLRSIVEIGAGPFTQIQYLLTPFRSIKQITLIEPNALDYMKLNNCAYRGGHLRGHPVSIISESIESIMKTRHQLMKQSKSLDYYSAVISINVVEHVRDALEYFRSLYDLLEDDGLLIFHERWYDSPQKADCVLENAEYLHPIRINKWVIDTFLEQFQPLYVYLNQTTRQMYSPCKEHGIYFIGRKLSTCS